MTGYTDVYIVVERILLYQAIQDLDPNTTVLCIWYHTCLAVTTIHPLPPTWTLAQAYLNNTMVMDSYLLGVQVVAPSKSILCDST